MTTPNRKAGASVRFSEITVWRTKLPGVKHAILPPHDDRPNPLVADSMLYVSVFSPGAVCALNRKTGKLIWRREIPKLAGPAVHLAGGKLFAKTAHTVFALEPNTGAVIWSFCPYGTSGEWIYSAPTVSGNSVFIGDRCGYLHCLDLSAGRPLWKQRTNKAKNDDVNTTPIVADGIVVVGTNAKRAVAYDVKTGERAWVCSLDGPSAFGPLAYKGLIAVFTDSVYLLKPETGKVLRKFSWKNDGITTATSTPKGIIATLRGKWPPSGTVELIRLTESGIQFSKTLQAFVAFLRYAKESKLVYVSHLEGIDICRPQSGEIICTVKLSKGPEEVGPVEVRDNKIYALSGDGYVYALRHPAS
jgi:outer membrane protein assembly factor BamB